MKFALALISGLFFVAPVLAQTVEVAPGVYVTKKTYDAPVNEQPFFGFADKSPAMLEADEKFKVGILKLAGTRERALDETIKRGWEFVFAGDWVNAGRRFNQAYLIEPGDSAVFHGFAVLAHGRFKDSAYADELFNFAMVRPNPSKNLRADYGRFLLIVGRPKDARPVLEQAVNDAPGFSSAWSNLAFARLQTGDAKGACDAAVEAEVRNPADNIKSDLNILRQAAKC